MIAGDVVVVVVIFLIFVSCQIKTLIRHLNNGVQLLCSRKNWGMKFLSLGVTIPKSAWKIKYEN